MTGYAKINEEYVCGRKFCKSCLKDCYRSDWIKRNNGLCPFCEGVCSCTRCIRNEKMNKLKSYFISLGGDINHLQSEGLVESLPIKKDDQPFKLKQKSKKSVKLPRQAKSRKILKERGYQHVTPVQGAS